METALLLNRSIVASQRRFQEIDSKYYKNKKMDYVKQTEIKTSHWQKLGKQFWNTVDIGRLSMV